jgi:streptomycin 6-kinase
LDNCLIDSKLIDRMKSHARQWAMIVDNTIETESSLIALGRRGETSPHQPVVLKVIKREGDEWHSGNILRAFDANGFARVYEYAPGAVLLERLRPGNSLAEMSLSGNDDEATEILAGVIQQMRVAPPSSSAWAASATVWDWAKGFERYLTTGDAQIPHDLVESAGQLYLKLCATQREPRLLHGDLHHYNVLFDSERGWLAIDPKGVVGEVEYEIGAILRNPFERPDLFTTPATIDERTRRLSERLGLDRGRVLAWAFAQAVLSAIWDIEDGFPAGAMNPAIRLATVIHPILRGMELPQ